MHQVEIEKYTKVTIIDKNYCKLLMQTIQILENGESILKGHGVP